ncbi:DeoR/GlpR family DNA-binding transcription regulator [Pararhodobacter sp. SW119]|uniref:DeoR/GlpR family DNA-binding transcription regulator n=1 Tax=Pararhodobacter sp. SW119 TaxID=2780075 RepID=UPI001AE0159C|nr:DeoR/GlpR family DNA-binding transcription regulator [Pararhodobacter sp. SW119]
MLDAPRNTAYDLRRAMNASAKERIGNAVAAMVEDGATVFISIGTTPAFIANALRRRRNLTVVTNNLNAALALSEVESNRIILPGGEVRLPDRDLLGEAASAMFTRYRADFGIYGVGGIDADGALLDFHETEVAAREAIRLNARRAILVADRTKFGRLAPIVGGTLHDVDHAVIDARPDTAYAELLQSIGTRLLVAKESAT